MTDIKPRKRNVTPTQRKLCSDCNKSRTYSQFYKVDSFMFPDGMINICSICLRNSIDIENMDSVIDFLRQIDKPFIAKYWNESVNSGQYPLGNYMAKMNSLSQLKDKTFENSDGLYGNGKVDVNAQYEAEALNDIKGEEIEFSEELIKKWGTGYKQEEYLKLEKFYRDMRITHEIHTPIHLDQLTQLAYMSIERDRMRQGKDFNNYNKISKTMEDMNKSAGFRPVDRQGIDDATGIKSFSQIFETVEKMGFRKPPKVVFDEDIVDGIILSTANYYNRIVGIQILAQVPDEIKDELDEFYELDLEPVDMDEDDYENIDFTVDGEVDEDE